MSNVINEQRRGPQTRHIIPNGCFPIIFLDDGCAASHDNRANYFYSYTHTIFNSIISEPLCIIYTVSTSVYQFTAFFHLSILDRESQQQKFDFGYACHFGCLLLLTIYKYYNLCITSTVSNLHCKHTSNNFISQTLLPSSILSRVIYRMEKELSRILNTVWYLIITVKFIHWTIGAYTYTYRLYNIQ